MQTSGIASHLAVAALAAGAGALGVWLLRDRPGLDPVTTHGEWVWIKRQSDSVRAYVAYPERPDPAPAVIVIHEIFGLTDWEPTVGDKLAANGVDFVASGDAVVPIEVNPRWTGSMELVERAYGLSMFGVHATACVSRSLPAFDLRKARQGMAALGKAILFARSPVTLGDTRRWLDGGHIRDVPQPGERIAKGRPICTILAEGADDATRVLADLSAQHLITIIDAATVSWPEGKKRPKTRQLHNLTGAGALGGAFWGMLFGLIFFVPLLGAAIGAASGALAGSLRDVGIDDRFIDRIRAEVTPGTSALFVMSKDAVVDRVRDAFAGSRPELIFTNLSDEQETALREVFAEQDE